MPSPGLLRRENLNGLRKYLIQRLSAGSLAAAFAASCAVAFTFRRTGRLRKEVLDNLTDRRPLILRELELVDDFGLIEGEHSLGLNRDLA